MISAVVVMVFCVEADEEVVVDVLEIVVRDVEVRDVKWRKELGRGL
jgi:hypothetical protein